MSLKYEALKKAFRAIGFREKMNLSAEEIIAIKKKQNANMKIPELKDPSFETDLIHCDFFPVIRMIHKTKTDRANLFIIGGGMVTPPRPDSIKKALTFARETGCDVYVPYYPLCTEYPVTRAYHMIHETYKRMCRDYKPENISVLGTSSGGNLALGMIPYMNENYPDEPKPDYILAISPGTCVETEEEEKRLKELDQKDFLIPASYMHKAREILRHGDETVPEYMLALQTGDFSNSPKITLIYGDEETLYAFAPSFEEQFQKYNVTYDLIVDKGLFHCYPVFPLIKETKPAWKQMITLIRTHGSQGVNQ